MTANDPELDEFIRGTSDICVKSLEVLTEPFEYLVEIDQLYRDYFTGVVKLKASAGILLMSAHASLRAAMKLALSGQLVPVYMVLRGVLESSLYALAIVDDPNLESVWMNRHMDSKSRQVCRNAFSASKLFATVERVNNKGFADILREMYEALIDYGAHPNPFFILQNASINAGPGGHGSLDFAYAHDTGSPDLRQAIIACAETGIAVLLLLLMCNMDNRNRNQLNDRALQLRDKLPKVAEILGVDAPKDESPPVS